MPGWGILVTGADTVTGFQVESGAREETGNRTRVSGISLQRRNRWTTGHDTTDPRHRAFDVFWGFCERHLVMRHARVFKNTCKLVMSFAQRLKSSSNKIQAFKH